jgi:EAL domain-containing protein (putative c-di-GMP-specific phosphodiesterase class I)
LVAEGIETEETAELVARLGCTIGQGYLFDAPLSATAVAARIRSAMTEPETRRAVDAGT